MRQYCNVGHWRIGITLIRIYSQLRRFKPNRNQLCIYVEDLNKQHWIQSQLFDECGSPYWHRLCLESGYLCIMHMDDNQGQGTAIGSSQIMEHCLKIAIGSSQIMEHCL
eukprot:529348_1